MFESMSVRQRLWPLIVVIVVTVGVWPVGAAVVINEIMYHPASDVETQEYIELYNTGPAAVTLTGWRLADAIGYNFPAGKTIAPGAYLVIAKSVAAFRARYPGSAADVIGDYTGQLNNGGERILLYDAAMNLVDSVEYSDGGHWPEAADGQGSSLELINPSLDNAIAQSWAASSAGGTSGLRNSKYVANPRPFVVEPCHWPAVPHTTDAIAITARVYDDTAISSVSLYYKGDEAVGPFARMPMLDDGAHGDGAAGDGVYGALLPLQPQGTILEFWMRAADNTGQTTDIPSTAPLQNFLLQVDNQDFSDTSPTYRVVMKAADHLWLHDPVNQGSTRLNNATFICGDEIIYNVGVRLRGKGSRGRTRKSYRVQFTAQEPFHGVENMNLNAQWIRCQYLDMDLFRRAGMPAPATQFAYLVFKYNDRNTYYRYDGSPASEPNLATMGWRIQMQDMNKDFLRQWFPGHSGGNLYRGVWISGTKMADMTYYGPNKDDYRVNYEKHGNEAADDYSDVIRLCDIFTNTTTNTFTQTIAQYIETDEWMHFWSGLAMINIEETDIYNTAGDDYYMYFDPATSPPVTRAVLLPWDLDEANLNPTETIFACTLPRVKRFVENPDYTPKYFYYIQDMLDHYHTLDIMLPKIQALAPYAGFETSPASGVPRDTLSLAELTNYVRARIAFLESLISRDLTINVAGASKVGNEYLAFQPTVTLSGRGMTALTRWVKVNGNDAGYQFKTGNWGNTVIGLNPGLNTVVVECLTTAGASAVKKTLNIRYANNSTPVCGSLGGDAVWTATGGPYIVTCNVIVPAGRTLRIQPGTIVLFKPSCSIFTFGALLAEGTQAQPISFAPSSNGGLATLIPAGATWKYNDTGTDLGAAWRSASYNDSAWKSGPAQLGYGEGNEATVISYGGNANNKYPTYYFRRSFQLADPSVVTALTIRVVYDDGCAVYLNGNEVVRSNMPSGTISYGSWASTNLSDPGENAWNSFSISPSSLISGTNVVAAEVHQSGSSSSDVIFDFDMATSQTARWGAIGFNAATAPCRLAHCSVEGASTAQYAGRSYGGAVAVINSSVDIEDCGFRDYSANAVNATTGTGIVNVRRCSFDPSGIGCIASTGYALTVEDSTFGCLTQLPARAIDLRGQTTPAPLIRNNQFLGSSDDVLVLGNSNATIASNVIHNASDAGIQLGSASRCNIHHNVIYDCGRAIYIRNGSVATLDHNTLYGNTTGTQCRWEPGAPGTGSGTASITNTIVWAAAMPIVGDAASSMTVKYSDVAGGRTGTGNFNLDPQFLDAGTRDLHIAPTSPCANRGEGGTYVGAFPPLTPRTAARHWSLY
jgi:parallel beta-helix repeat protein